MPSVGVYLTSRDTVGLIDPALDDLQELGASRALLWVEAPDGRRAPLEALADWAQALRAAGIEPWLWTFPGAQRARSAGERLAQAFDATDAAGAILDIERPPPSSPAREWTREDALMLLDAVNGQCTGRNVGVTSYPLRSNFLSRVPLDVFTFYRLGCPQLYRSAAVDRVRENALVEWHSAHAEVRPIVGGFLGDAKRLESDLQAVVGSRYTHCDVWSLALLDRSERDVLRRWSSR